MTLHIADIALYQGALTVAQLRAAGFGAVNVKVSHGLTRKSVHPDARGWVRGARAAGMGVSTFHWLDDSAAGAEQAAYAYQRIVELGGPAGMAHVVDVEATVDPPSQVQYRDYVTTMTRLLGRPICTYTGDWWWRPRGWPGMTPWLWASPNAGYLDTYPGDTSSHWAAGYGAWTDLAVMQYRVAPVAGVRVSQSAIRDPAVWTAMTGVAMTAAKPHHRATRALMLRHLDLHPGSPVHADLDPMEAGIVGDTDHAEGGDSYHLGADQIRSRGNRNRYSVDESARDQRGLDGYASAVDYGYFRVTTSRGAFDLYDYNAWLIALCRAGDPDTADLREVIYSPDGRTVTRWDALGIRTTGDASHLTHTHHSEFRDADGHRMLRLATRWLQYIALIPQEDDVPLTPAEIENIAKVTAAKMDDAVIAVLEGARGKTAVADAVWTARLVDPRSKTTPPATITAGTYQRYTDLKHDDTRKVTTAAAAVTDDLVTRVGRAVDAVGGILVAFDAREAAEVPATPGDTARAVLDAIAADSPEQTATILRTVLGIRAEQVGRLLAGL